MSFFHRYTLTFALILGVALSLNSISVKAQQSSQAPNIDSISDEQFMEFYRRAMASGMSEIQMEQAALAQGFTLTDISNARKRLAKIQSEQNKNGKDSVISPRRQIGKLSLKTKNTTLKDSLKLPPKVQKKLLIYGSTLFENSDLAFEPNLRLATPTSYVLGPDDELLVDIYGNASDSYKLKVSPEGTVKVLNFAPIYVSGLTIDEAKEKIISRLRQAYAGLNSGGGTRASINLGNIRSIKVTITGEVKKPGTYTVSSLATVFNALYLCGGPDSTGTYRSIKVIRNNKAIRTIDLYDFLLKGEQKNNILLQDQDVIHVSYYTTRIEIDGEVKRPAIFESKEGETFTDILSFAGGFNESAYKASITLYRNSEREQQVLNLKQENFGNVAPQTGDRYVIGKILNRFQNRIQLTGAVFRPGDYALTSETKTLTQLLAQADGLREDAFKNRILVHRLKDNFDPEVVSVDFTKIISGASPDLDLKARDSIVVKSVKELREEYFVTILGAINQPGDALFADNMSVSDLITQAGGFVDGGIPIRIEVARRIRDDNMTDVPDNYNTQIIPLTVDAKLGLTQTDVQFKLLPFDIVYIRTSPRYEIQQNVTILGEVIYPGTYAIVNNTERISSLIERSGGIRASAYLDGAILRRGGERVALQIKNIIEQPAIESNLTLQNEDTLIIPRQSELVRVTGAVLNTSILNYSKDFNFNSYLSQAGGYGDRAHKSKVYVRYANGYAARTKHFLFFRIHPKIEPGSTIFVPYKPKNERRSDLSAPVLLSFLGTLAIAAATLLR